MSTTMPIRAPKVVQGPHTVTVDDHEQILEVTGSPIMLPFSMTPGFYTTLINARGGVIQILIAASGGVIKSPLGGTTLTLQYEQCTVYYSATNGWTAPTL